MIKFFKWLSPITKYLTLVGMIGAFVFGIGVTRTYYLGIINKQDAALAQKHSEYLSKVIDLDQQYVIKMDKLKKELTVTQKALKDETKKPAYSCPIPDAGIGLLNSALNSKQSSNNRK